MLEEVNQSVLKKMKDHHALSDQAQRIDHPVNSKKIQISYIQGSNSIIKNMPMPEVGFLHGCARARSHKIEVSNINMFMHYSQPSMHKTETCKK